MRAEPSEKVLGGRLVDGTSEDDPGVAGIVAGIGVAGGIGGEEEEAIQEGRGWPLPVVAKLVEDHGRSEAEGLVT